MMIVVCFIVDPFGYYKVKPFRLSTGPANKPAGGQLSKTTNSVVQNIMN
jgi:hypothetical protein